jgi:hypothetical protein
MGRDVGLSCSPCPRLFLKDLILWMIAGVTQGDDDRSVSRAQPGIQDIRARKAGVIHLERPLASRAEAFSVLSGACQAASAGRALVKLFVDGVLVPDPAHPLLPIEGEHSDDYLTRVAQRHDFAIYCGSIQAHSPLLFERLRRLLALLFGADWIPAGWIDAELFVGRYEHTPAGVHQEQRYNLHCVLDGRKTMLVWPPDAAAAPAARDMAGDALVLPGGPGDVIHWPPQHWHVGRSPQLSIAINVAIYPAEPFDLMLRALIGELHQKWPARQMSNELFFPEGDASLGTRQQLEILRDVASSPAMEQGMSIESLRVHSSSGFRVVPPRAEVTPLAEDAPLRRAAAARLCWMIAGEDLVYLGNGHAGRMLARSSAADLLSAIDAGERFTVSDLVHAHRGDIGADVIRSLVGDLYAMRVIEDDHACAR